MSSIPSWKDCVDFLVDQERDLDLLLDTPRGFPLWPALRATLGHRLSTVLGLGQTPHQSATSGLGFWEQWARHFETFTSQNPLFQLSQRQRLILEHPRTAVRQGQRLDPHAAEWEERWDAEGLSWLSLSDASVDGFQKADSARRFSTEPIYQWARIEARLRGWRLPESYRAKMRALDRAALETWNVEWGAERFASQRFRALTGRKAGYLRLLRAVQPERVYIVVAYGSHVALTAAARELEIPVTEIQHGAFSRYHLGYAFADLGARVPGLPDNYLAWSQDWADTLIRIQPGARVEVHEPRWLEERRAQWSSVAKQKTVLVLSQGLLGDALARALTPHLARFAGYRVLYKLHPGEYGRWHDYPILGRLAESGQVEVLEDCDLPRLMAESECAVGVYSTALYEALELGCRLYLLPLPGVEALEDLVRTGRAELLGTAVSVD